MCVCVTCVQVGIKGQTSAPLLPVVHCYVCQASRRAPCQFVCLSPSPVSVVGVLGNRAELPLYSSGIRTQVLTFA